MMFRVQGEPHEDKRLRQMILVSAALHVVIILWVVLSGALFRSTQPRATAITVELVNPAAVGTNLPHGGRSGTRAEGESGAPPKPAPPPPKPEVKPPLPGVKPPPPTPQKAAVKLPEKEKPVEKPPVKPEPEKPKAEPKPAPQPVKAAKAEEKKPEPEKTVAKKVEEKNPEPPKIETKPQKTETKPEKTETKSEPAEVKPEPEKPPVKTADRTPEEKPTKTEPVSSEERERQITAALDRIKARVQPKEEPGVTNGPPGGGPKGSGPITKGGEPGEGGGGSVRGLEFILYTQQLQRRVQESWIVTEKRPGLIAEVSFRIQADGEVQDVELMKSSGDVAFDQSVLRAIRKAAPFPSPPQAYAEEFATQKILMNFGGEGRVN